MEDAAEADEIDEKDEVRFALTSEAGLNDGLAFPFVYAAIFLATLGGVSSWGLRWVGWELVGKTVIGVVVGAATGGCSPRSRSGRRRKSLRLAETGEPLLALAATLLAYGAGRGGRRLGVPRRCSRARSRCARPSAAASTTR